MERIIIQEVLSTIKEEEEVAAIANHIRVGGLGWQEVDVIEAQEVEINIYIIETRRKVTKAILVPFGTHRRPDLDSKVNMLFYGTLT